MKEQKNFKRENAITLIALVITIIVLLILAGVSIAMVTGENGIIGRANDAVDLTKYKTAEEKVNLAVIAAMADDGEMTVAELKTEVQSQDGTVNGTTFPVQVQMDRYTFTVEETGKVINKEEGGTQPLEVITASDIANLTDKGKIYGAVVKGYELPNGTTTDVGWKIFYADENNIYLIADNYVEIENLPNSTTEAGVLTGNRPGKGTGNYLRAATFTHIVPDYVGSARITDSKLKALNNSYFNERKYTSTNNNMKSVAYMLDTNAWNSKFKDVNNKAEYVIGGPTVELLFKSYNDKYKTEYEFQATNATGYQIRKTVNDGFADDVKMLDISDSLYVITSDSDAFGYWVASPSVIGSDYLITVPVDGSVFRDYYGNTSSSFYGFRPLVALKSGVQLQKNADGTYTIL